VREIYWSGPAPEKCELCGREIPYSFIDGRTLLGSWACMCEHCFYDGPGIGRLGVDNGQRFIRLEDGRWQKVAG